MPYTEFEYFEMIEQVYNELDTLLPVERAQELREKLDQILPKLADDGSNLSKIKYEAAKSIQVYTLAREELKRLIESLNIGVLYQGVPGTTPLLV